MRGRVLLAGLTIVLGIILSLSATASAADWPQWRGPNRDGISQETGLLKDWPADGPNALRVRCFREDQSQWE